MSFPQFACLPPEIQLKIWAANLPPPRIVDVFAVPVSESLQPRFETKSDATDTDTTASPTSISTTYGLTSSGLTASNTNREDGEKEIHLPGLDTIKWTRTFMERIYSTPHDLRCLHICSEARRIALKRYVRVNADLEFRGQMEFVCKRPPSHSDEQYALGTLKGSRPYALFDPSRDILFLQDPPRTLDRIGGLVISSLDVLLRWCPIPVSALKRLAVPYYTWRKTRNNGRLDIVREFEALEELFVNLLGDNYTGSYRATWSDVVGGLWSHVQKVEDEVRADVKNLKRRFPDWNVPKVRVVRHRGVLMEEFRG